MSDNDSRRTSRSKRRWSWIRDDLAKRPLIAVGVPVKTAVMLGHFRSSLVRKSVGRKGHPLPWYTYPAIHFLSTIDFSGLSVLEFGGGQSSVWWGKRAQSVVCLETDLGWFQYIRGLTSELRSVECIHCTSEQDQADWPLGKIFDVVIVDGGNRLQCATTAVEVVSDNGWILVDDSEGNWGPDGTYPIIDLMHARGFSRVDFYGFAPGNYSLRCTSLFFRSIHGFRLGHPPMRERLLMQKAPAINP